MLRVLALFAAIGVTAAAFWLTDPDGGKVNTSGNAGDRPAPPPVATGPATASPTPAPATTPTRTPATPAPTVKPTPSKGPATAPRSPATRPQTKAADRPAMTYANTAAFTNISDGTSVERCERLSGRSSLAPTKTVFAVHRRTSPADGTYCFFYIDNYENGNVPPTWTTRIWFGSSPNGHRYDVFLVIMDVDDARQFWAANQVPDGSYADASAIPSGADVAAKVSVVQTGIADC